MRNKNLSVQLIEPTFKPVSLAEVALSDNQAEMVSTATSMAFDGIIESQDTSINIAVIPVHGYLMHRNSYHYNNWFTGYNFIENALHEAVNDDSIDGIVLDVNSGGGMVDGAFELAETIRELGQQKPIRAIVDSHAYSAAYLLASATGHISVPKLGGVGSIGVVTMHVDISKALDENGYKVTMIYAGKHKVDGNPYEALSEEVKQNIEEQLNVSYDMFVDAVDAGRPGMSSVAIKNTEAATFQGEKALEVGLVDMVVSPKEAYSVFALELSQNTVGGIEMAKENQNTVDASKPEENTVADVDASALTQEGKQAERTRIAGIVGSDEASGREDLANHLAFDTDMTVEAATAILAKSPTAVVAAEDSGVVTPNMDFNTAMQDDNPQVSADAGVDEPNAVNSLLSAHTAATGQKH